MIETKKSIYVFGPVPSRRLGKSLGIDPVPYKTCSYDCIYCQLGRTTNKTIQRMEYVKTDDIIRQLYEKLNDHIAIDYITFSGSGEPTLYTGIPRIIAEIRKITKIPIAIITNGSLLWMEEVRELCMGADVVLPSLDAGNESLFELINRPYPEITFSKMVQGLGAFRNEFRGKFWLEVFLLGGITGGSREVLEIKKYADKINPDKIQVNTSVRPTAEEFAFRLKPNRLLQLCRYLGDKAEVIADLKGIEESSGFKVHKQDLLSLIARRPCSLEDISIGLGLHPDEVIKYLEEFERKSIIKCIRRDENLFYTMAY